MLTEERTKRDQAKVKRALVTAGIILLVILLSVGASILACKKSASTVKNGLSAYEIAQAYGYEGSVQDWLTSLNGKSAYEIAKESGYTGTESEFSASLAANAKGDAVSIKSASFNQAGELILLLSDGSSLNVGRAVGAAGADGKNGADGADGKDGANGSAGVSIINAKVNEKGQLLLAFSDGKTINLDKITGTNGQDGIGIASSEINANGELVLTYSNGQTANLGTVIGAKGEKGDTGAAGTPGEKGDKGDTGAAGEKGETGNGISGAAINANGELVLTYSNGQSDNLGTVIGAKGEKGDTGATGAQGEQGIQGEKGDKGDTGATGQNGQDGKDGKGVASAVINEEGKLVITYSDGTIATLGKVIGPRGEQGVQGEKGDTGAQGEKGEKGEQGAQGEQGVQGIQGEKGEQGTQGEKGDKGDTGAAGQDGQDGQDGVGISRAEINAENELVLTLSNGQSINLGAVKGEKGDKGDAGVGIANVVITEAGNLKVALTNNTSIDLGNIKGADGIGITKSEINAQGHLVLTYSNGNTSDLGVVVGQDGARGADGKDGADGVGISNVAVSTDGVLVITLSNGEVKTLGNIKGEKGDKGDTGRGIDHMDIVNGELWVFYTDNTNQNLGSVGSGAGEEEGSVLEFLLLPDGTYGVRAGEKATNVTSIDIPEIYNGKQVTQILAKGFTGLSNLMEVTLPKTLTTIGEGAFQGIPIKEIVLPSSLSRIEPYAFSECSQLTNINIPKSVKFIGRYAFSKSALQNAYFDDYTGWTTTTPDVYFSGGQLQFVAINGFNIEYKYGYKNYQCTYRLNSSSAANALVKTITIASEPISSASIHVEFYEQDWSHS